EEDEHHRRKEHYLEVARGLAGHRPLGEETVMLERVTLEDEPEAPRAVVHGPPVAEVLAQVRDEEEDRQERPLARAGVSEARDRDPDRGDRAAGREGEVQPARVARADFLGAEGVAPAGQIVARSHGRHCSPAWPACCVFLERGFPCPTPPTIPFATS